MSATPDPPSFFAPKGTETSKGTPVSVSSRTKPSPLGAKNEGGSATAPAAASTRNYTIGFVLSLVLTALPYMIVRSNAAQGWTLLLLLVGFAILQLAVQLVFFLHIDRELGRRWNLIAFLFAALVVFIVVAGSLWIMHNLDYRMMPHDMEQTIIQDEGIHH